MKRKGVKSLKSSDKRIIKMNKSLVKEAVANNCIENSKPNTLIDSIIPRLSRLEAATTKIFEKLEEMTAEKQ